MKPTLLDIETTGDLEGQKVQMDFDANSINHLMSILTDLYSDPELAVIREYSSNALDSHIVAEQTRPVEITLPGILSPMFHVKDYGVGLGVDEICNIYSKYGASTKRDSNSQTGMLGLGCKSALTYVQQFTLVGIKNGVKTSVVVSRQANGSGAMEIVDTCATDEPNGVEVAIPIKGYASFISKAKEFYRFWQPGQVIVNGQPPEFVGGMKVNESAYLVAGLYNNYIVMGGVAYPAKGLTSKPKYGYSIVSYVDIGDVEFTPSREALHYTTKTKETINRLNEAFENDISIAVLNDIDASPTHAMAFITYNVWAKMYTVPRDVTYRGQKIPNLLRTIDMKVYDAKLNRNAVVGETVLYSSKYAGIENAYIYNAPKSAGSGVKSRLVQWGNGKYDRFVLAPDKAWEPWITRWVDWKDIKAQTKIVREKTAVTPGYEVWNGFWKRQPIDSSRPVIYCEASSYFAKQTGWTSWVGDATIVNLPANRVTKFLRDYPGAQKVGTILFKQRNEALAKVSEEDKLKREDLSSFVDLLDPTRVDDPALRARIERSKKMVSPEMKEYLKYVRLVGEGYEPKIGFNWYETYPLLKYLTTYGGGPQCDHTYFYINAVYKERVQNEI